MSCQSEMLMGYWSYGVTVYFSSGNWSPMKIKLRYWSCGATACFRSGNASDENHCPFLSHVPCLLVRGKWLKWEAQGHN